MRGPRAVSLFRLVLVLPMLWGAGYCLGADEQPPWTPPDYFAEPQIPFDEEIQEQKQEEGWHWTEFRYTSMVVQGEPTRVHAVYAVPDGADAGHRVPAILATHGIFGYVRDNGRYWSAVTTFVKAGYAVLFFDWYPDFAANFKPKTPDEPKHFTTFGKLDYLHPWTNYNLPGDDFKDSLYYQVAMAAKRGITWLQAKPEVDGAKLGATGASYGGILSSMIAGIDPRLKAVQPCVYAAGFGPNEEAYNTMNLEPATLATWKSRFDSQVLLAHRSVPILHTVGSNDPTFLLTKAASTFAAMQPPKAMLIGPNQGHGYWDVDQGVLFFNSILKGLYPRPTLVDLKVTPAGRQLNVSVQATGDAPRKVEFFVTEIFELDPDKEPAALRSDVWKWVGVDGKDDGKGQLHAAVGPAADAGGRDERAGLPVGDGGGLRPQAAL